MIGLVSKSLTNRKVLILCTGKFKVDFGFQLVLFIEKDMIYKSAFMSLRISKRVLKPVI